MSFYIVIREYKASDVAQVSDLVRNAYLSNVTTSFYNALLREITFQLMVSSAAIMFIFMGIHLVYCILAIPIVLVIMYACIYTTYLFKAMELMGKRPMCCWVAEACVPFYTTSNQQKENKFRIISEEQMIREGIDVGNLQRKVVGTISVSNYYLLDDAAWLNRLAVDSNYRHKGIGHALVETVKTYCRHRNYNVVLLAMSECQESARQLFISTGFQCKQMYHKHLIGSIVMLLMYQLECNIARPDL